MRLDHADNTDKLSGGGLVSYVNNKYEVDYLSDWSFVTEDIEVQWMKLTLPDTHLTYVANVYRSPTGCVGSAINALEEKLDFLHSQGIHDALIMGDFNIVLNKSSSVTNKLQQFYRNNLLSQLIKSPTHVTNTGKTLIGHVTMNNESFYNIYDVVDLGWSDHYNLCYSEAFQAKTLCVLLCGEELSHI